MTFVFHSAELSGIFHANVPLWAKKEQLIGLFRRRALAMIRDRKTLTQLLYGVARFVRERLVPAEAELAEHFQSLKLMVVWG